MSSLAIFVSLLSIVGCSLAVPDPLVYINAIRSATNAVFMKQLIYDSSQEFVVADLAEVCNATAIAEGVANYGGQYLVNSRFWPSGANPHLDNWEKKVEADYQDSVNPNNQLESYIISSLTKAEQKTFHDFIKKSILQWTKGKNDYLRQKSTCNTTGSDCANYMNMVTDVTDGVTCGIHNCDDTPVNINGKNVKGVMVVCVFSHIDILPRSQPYVATSKANGAICSGCATAKCEVPKQNLCKPVSYTKVTTIFNPAVQMNQVRQATNALYMNKLEYDPVGLMPDALEIAQMCNKTEDTAAPGVNSYFWPSNIDDDLVDWKTDFEGTAEDLKKVIENKFNLFLLKSIKAWKKEKENYNFKINKCKKIGICDNYIQLVTNDTVSVGCGISNCTMPYKGKLRDGVFVVCKFDPPPPAKEGTLRYTAGTGGQRGTAGSKCAEKEKVKEEKTNLCEDDPNAEIPF